MYTVLDAGTQKSEGNKNGHRIRILRDFFFLKPAAKVWKPKSMSKNAFVVWFYYSVHGVSLFADLRFLFWWEAVFLIACWRSEKHRKTNNAVLTAYQAE